MTLWHWLLTNYKHPDQRWMEKRSQAGGMLEVLNEVETLEPREEKEATPCSQPSPLPPVRVLFPR